jgi:ketosteroid isomerase-like protein
MMCLAGQVTSLRRWRKAAIGQAEALEMAAIQPGSVTIELKTSHVRTFGEIGIIYCEMHFGAIMKDGVPLSMDMRYTHTWLWTEAGWKIIGGMSVPLS